MTQQLNAMHEDEMQMPGIARREGLTMDQRLQEIDNKIGDLHRHMSRQDKDLEIIRFAVVGDGASGLMAKFAALEARVLLNEKDLMESREERRWLYRSIIGAFITTIVGGLSLAGWISTLHK